MYKSGGFMRTLFVSIFAYIFFILFCGNSFASNQSFDFRSSRWEMSKEEVIKSEPNAEWFETKNSLTFITKICSEKVEVSYNFEKDTLVFCSYDFKNIINNNPEKLKNDILENFKKKHKLIYSKHDGSFSKLKNNRTDVQIICDDTSLLIIFWNSNYIKKIKKDKERKYKEDIKNM